MGEPNPPNPVVCAGVMPNPLVEVLVVAPPPNSPPVAGAGDPNDGATGVEPKGVLVLLPGVANGDDVWGCPNMFFS